MEFKEQFDRSPEWSPASTEDRVPERKNLKPTLVSVHGKDKARDLSKRQLIALLDQAVDRGSPVTANRT